jgi:peptide/nickel transport system permease protein
MIRYILRRLAFVVLIVFAITIMTFFVSHVIPGDPAALAAGPGATQTQVVAIRNELGLNLPLPVQYVHYLDHLIHLDFGTSIVTGLPVSQELSSRIPATMELVLVSFIAYLVLGTGLAVLAATSRRSWLDGAIRIGTTTAYAIPAFVLAFWLQLLLFFRLGVLPDSGRLSIGATPPPHVTGFYLIDSVLAGQWGTFWDAAQHIIMPAIALTLGLMAIAVRIIRATVMTELDKDYVRMLRLRGIPQRRIIWRHVLRNSLVPSLALFGIQFGYLVGGTIVVETIFDWPGLGSYAFTSISSLDYSPVMAVTLVTATVFVLANFVIDLLYPVIDPRIRLWGERT